MARAPLDVNPDASNPTVVVTHVRAGTGHWTLARNYAVDITSTSHQRVHSHPATSCRNPPQDRACDLSPHTAQASPSWAGRWCRSVPDCCRLGLMAAMAVAMY